MSFLIRGGEFITGEERYCAKAHWGLGASAIGSRWGRRFELSISSAVAEQSKEDARYPGDRPGRREQDG